MSRTVNDLLDQVRQLIDEDNEVTVTDADILDALNRGQDYAADILAKHYEDPMITKITVSTVAGQELYDIPETAFQERLEKVEVDVNGYFFELQRVSYRDIGTYESPATSAVPLYYTVQGNQFQIVPTPTGTHPVRVWYLEEPRKLVKQQGRIQTINTVGNYVYVDLAGEELTTEADRLASYANIIDGTTGKVKGSLQIQSIEDNRITFKTTPSRTSVLNSTITGDLSSITVSADDYVCLLEGSCIPFMRKPLTIFLIQFAVGELRRKLGQPFTSEAQVLMDFEKQVEGSWVGREQQLRVKRRSNKWPFPWRRWLGSSDG